MQTHNIHICLTFHTYDPGDSGLLHQQHFVEEHLGENNHSQSHTPWLGSFPWLSQFPEENNFFFGKIYFSNIYFIVFGALFDLPFSLDCDGKVLCFYHLLESDGSYPESQKVRLFISCQSAANNCSYWRKNLESIKGKYEVPCHTLPGILINNELFDHRYIMEYLSIKNNPIIKILWNIIPLDIIRS